MKLNSIKEVAESKGVSDKINWGSAVYVRVKIPKKVLDAMKLYEVVFFGVGDVKEYNNPIATIMHTEDYLAQLKSVVMPKPRRRRIQKLPKEV